MNDYYNLSKPQLSLQIETLIFSCLSVCFCIGSQCIASTALSFDSRSGFISIGLYQHDVNRKCFEGRISFVVSCDFESRDKLNDLHSYLTGVLENGYSRFGGFSPMEAA